MSGRLMDSDRTFRYVPSFDTDIKKTFARTRREQAQAKPKIAENVQPLKRRAA